MRQQSACALGFLLCLFPVSSNAQETEPSKPERIVELSNRQISAIQANPEQFLRSSINHIYRVAPDGVLSEEAIVLLETRQEAEQRGRLLQSAAYFDLNGDLSISAEEIERHLPFLQSGMKGSLQTLRANADTDADGTISREELIAHVNDAATASVSPNRDANRELLAFDIDGNGEVDITELVATVRAVQNGELQATQPQAAAARQPSTGIPIARMDGSITSLVPYAAQRQQAPDCDLPPVPAKAEVVLLSPFGGASLSNLAVGSQDRITTTGTFTIEDGEAPLYVINLSQSTAIWQFGGATDRISDVVIGVWQGGAGVTGLKEDKIHFIPGRDCLPNPFRDSGGGDALRAAAVISNQVGQAPDHVVIPGTVNQVALPSGEVLVAGTQRLPGPAIVSNGRRTAITDDGPVVLDSPAEVRQRRVELQLVMDLSRQHPGGLAELDPADVIASANVEPYDVLPRTAGLQQLIQSGSLTRTSDGYYLITGPIPRFPAGLHGGHRVRFILGKGVPMPAGSPGHSPVYSEEAGECIGQSLLCR